VLQWPIACLLAVSNTTAADGLLKRAEEKQSASIMGSLSFSWLARSMHMACSLKLSAMLAQEKEVRSKQQKWLWRLSVALCVYSHSTMFF